MTQEATHKTSKAETTGTEALRANPMMAHLLDSLSEGKDIGHYGRLTFTMIARHFLSEEEVCELLAQDRDFSEPQAAALYQQVAERGYNPPRAEKISQWQAEQEFPIIPHGDPDAANVYRDLKFPDGMYKGIEHYHEEKAAAEAA